LYRNLYKIAYRLKMYGQKYGKKSSNTIFKRDFYKFAIHTNKIIQLNIKKTDTMLNLTINRPVNQQFVQYPHWIAQAKEFALDEVGLLAIILSFKDYLSKSSLVNFTSDGKRAIDTAWKGLIQKGILVAKSFKSADNRFAWSYTVNLEKVSIISPKKTVVNYAEIADKYGVSEDVARAITEEAIAQAMPSASIPNIQTEPIPMAETAEIDKKVPKIAIPTPEMGSKPLFEMESTPISMPDMGFNPFFEVQSMSIPMLEIGSKPIIEVPKMSSSASEMVAKPIIEVPIPTMEIASKPIIEVPKMSSSASEMVAKPIIEVPIPTMEIASKPIIEVPKIPSSTMAMVAKPIIDSTFIAKPTHTPHEKRNGFAEALLNDKNLLDYLRTESPLFEVTPEIISAFHKRLDMNQLEHPNYEKYAQHFRNWLPDFLKYKDVGNKIKAVKQNVVNDSNEKCGSNKEFNILRKKLQNPQENYMTYQGWVRKLDEITENLSPADIAYKNEIVSIYKNGHLLQRFQEMKSKIANT
jgi:hypothetical protein